MSLEARLARQLVREHPERAAVVLDRRQPGECADLLTGLPAAEVAPVLARLSPYQATAALEHAKPEAAARLLESMELDAAARILRRVGDRLRESVLEALSPARAETLRTLLRFAENTAGALMDPQVLALAEDLRVEEALVLIRESPSRARYNLYVVDREQVLVGVVNLRELHLARPQARLEEIMVRQPLRLEARAERARVVSHPGWREVHSIPVVDERGRYLGAVRYRTLRQLEEELLRGAGADVEAADALGDLFATGAAAVLDALTGSSGSPERKN